MHDEMLFNECVLKLGGRGVILVVLNGWEAMPDLPKKWSTKVRTVLLHMEQAERIDDPLYTKVRPHMVNVAILFA